MPRRGVANTVCVDTNGGVVLSTLIVWIVTRRNTRGNRLAAGTDTWRRLHRQSGAVSTSTLVRGIIHLLAIR